MRWITFWLWILVQLGTGQLLPVFAAAPSCNEDFRQDADRIVNELALVCRQVEKLEPSICQRALMDRCTRGYVESRRIRQNVCQNLQNEGAYLQGQQYESGASTQVGAQRANEALNNDTQVISDSMAELLRQEKEKIEQDLRANRGLLAQDVCTKSLARPLYAEAGQRVNHRLEAMRDLLERLRQRKRSDAQAAQSISQESKQKGDELASLKTPAASSASSGGESPLVPAAAIGGIAGAGLLAAALIGNRGPTIDGISPAPNGSNMDAYRGDVDKFVEENGLVVDQSFRDQDKRQIAQALNYIPACHRRHLRGLRIKNNPGLTWQSTAYLGRCLPGRNSAAGVIELNPRCYGSISTALVVHEMVHVVANAAGMYPRYAPTYHGKPGCPVSDYARSNPSLNEDFAEAGRLAVYPGSGGQSSAACAAQKIAAARDIMACR